MKAQIKLKFKDKYNMATVCIRNLQLTQAKTRMTYKATDSGLVRFTVDPVSKQRIKEEVSHKCTDMDKMMPGLLGIPVSILEHVV